MELKDITNYASKSTIKPELNAIFVKHIEGGIVYVATDSFRLVEVTCLDESIQGLMREGFYTLPQWKLLVKATKGKKIDYAMIKMIGSSVDPLAESTYPEYQTLYKGMELVTANFTDQKYNAQYFSEFLTLIPTDKFNNFNFADLKQIKDKNNSVLIYKDETITILLMPCNN